MPRFFQLVLALAAFAGGLWFIYAGYEHGLSLAGRTETAVLIVGHNPMMEEFFRLVVGQPVADAAAPNGFPTAALATIDFDRKPSDRDYTGGRLSCRLKRLWVAVSPTRSGRVARDWPSLIAAGAWSRPC